MMSRFSISKKNQKPQEDTCVQIEGELVEDGVVMTGNFLKSLRQRKNQWKKRKKQDRLLGIGQIGGGFMRKLARAYKATSYHLT
jgi:hypothetical protein